MLKYSALITVTTIFNSKNKRRYTFVLCMAILCFNQTFAQNTVSSEILTPKQVLTIFSDTICKKLNINFPINRVYKNADKGGQYYCILTESRERVNTDQDVFNNKVKAINVKFEHGTFTKLWEINDNIQAGDYGEESIWFWTKYCQFGDYDNDGLIDPMVIYGTRGMNGYSDGRLKIFIYYKGQKIAIRHQNGTLDDERETRIDNSFYSLPIKLQDAVKDKINLITENKHSIFPYGWQKAMKNRKIFFSERGD